MNDEATTTTAPAVPAAKPAAPKTKPKAAKKPAAKSTPKAKPANGITGVQYRALKVIAKAPNGLSRKQIAEKAFNGNSVNFVPILDPLVKAKLVKVIELGGDPKTPDVAKETLFEATAAGRKVAAGAPPVTARGRGEASHASLPKAGGVITKTYLGKEYKVKVEADGTFRYAGKPYTSLTAAAKAIRGSEQEVNGWAFFGLVKDKA